MVVNRTAGSVNVDMPSKAVLAWTTSRQVREQKDYYKNTSVLNYTIIGISCDTFLPHIYNSYTFHYSHSIWSHRMHCPFLCATTIAESVTKAYCGTSGFVESNDEEPK